MAILFGLSVKTAVNINEEYHLRYSCTWITLKILPSSHTSATWCIVVNVSVYLLLSIKSSVLDITIGMIKKVIHSNGKNPSFYNITHNYFINISLKIFKKSMNSFVV